MRIRGIGLREIAKYMNDNGYGRIIKTEKSKRYGETIVMSYQILSEMFKDPFYYGLLIQRIKTYDLNAYEFEKAVSEDDYNEVQRMSRATVSPLVKNRRMTFYPLRGMVKCSFCGRVMSPGASKSRAGTRYLYYRW